MLLTTESFVKKGCSQRRPGIHTEKHSATGWGGGWGDGINDENKYYGGLFMASNVDDSVRLWNMKINNPGFMGDCENLKTTLCNEIVPKKNELFWLTDSCPHESLPINKNIYRQWFRYVTSNVGLWYARYSTENRLGIKPACPIDYNFYKEKNIMQHKKI